MIEFPGQRFCCGGGEMQIGKMSSELLIDGESFIANIPHRRHSCAMD